MRVTIQRIRIAAVFVASVAAVLVGFSFASPASAHGPLPEDAADTPLGGQSRSHPALGNYESALSHSQGANSLFRNPTCGAHYGENGIHPPGNP